MNARLLGAWLALTTITLEAQAQWHVGGLVDVNRASTSFDPDPQFREYSSRTAFGIGAVVDYELTNRIDVHAQLMLQGKGNTMHDEDFPSDVVWKTSWLEIPVLVRYTISNEGRFHPFVAAGPTIGFLQSAKFTADGEPDQDDEDAESLDLGLVIGGGARMPHGRSVLFGEVRYAHGLTNVTDSGGVFTVTNRGLQLLVGVTFPLGQE